ncbi:MAG TPA: hypothetical protein VMV34_04615 [Terriglobia bacterium]|nr:hypothetical protein [Terriglobia bacterium]
MTRRQTAAAILAGCLTLVVIALLAYRLGIRHAARPEPFRSEEQTSQDGCVAFDRAGHHTGENTCVSGRVLRVFTARSGSTFLDFCKDYRQCPFTSVIFAGDRSQFGNVASLEGKRVQITGEITTYNGRAEIIIHEPRQIRLAP